MADATSFTKTVHKKPYPGISPLRPELSQEGKTILIAGGSSGIGFAIARGFAKASAARIIILGRRPDVLKDATAEIARVNPKTVVEGRACNVSDLADSEALWASLASDGVHVDVLVMNAAGVSSPNKPILESSVDEIWSDYIMNARTLLDFTLKFSSQKGEEGRQKFLVNVSTSAVHRWLDQAPQMPGYGLTKNAGTLLVQQIAKDMDADKMQAVSFHPGGILTELARSAGYDENSMDWDHVDLPGHFAVWLASPEAKFLHGRYVYASWDVEELMSEEMAKRIETDPFFLRIGVVGLSGKA